jgi:glutamine synthetase
MGMKEWALSKGVTLYALVSTAQVQLLKSMMPFETSYDGSDPVEKFGGAQLVQQEPDASSFLMEELEHLKQRIYRMGSTSPAFIWYHFMYSYCLFRIPEKH